MTKSRLDAALEYYERGWSIIPISHETKRPLIKWLEYQERTPTEEEIETWWADWPDADMAVVTGAVSKVVVVDCDNEDAAHAAYDAGMRSPIKAKTKRGMHLYFLHPMDGKRRGPRAGVNVRTIAPDWPRIPGLDFRGDGSYAILPPSTGYEWDYPAALDWDDAPIWKDWSPSIPTQDDGTGQFSFEELDLTKVRTLTEEDFMSEWDRTAAYVAKRFPTTGKIPTGLSNGRNERVMRHISDCILDGHWGDDLRLHGYAFMHEFFAESLPEPEFQATVRSIEDAERRNHPERFAEDGSYIPRQEAHRVSQHGTVVPLDEPEPEKAPTLIQMKDAMELERVAGGRSYLIEPWLPPQTIVQVYGYSGHGKSLFVQHAMGALASGRKYFGPFEVGRAGRVLYLDYENGMLTLSRRLADLQSAQGDTGDRLQIWTPFIEDRDINMRTADGMASLQKWVAVAKPDVVVVDTIRSAFPGMAENAAEEWSRLNQLALKIRNAGMAIILVHHANKPGEGGVGREAGSSNQLTVLETQMRIAQVFEDEAEAKMRGGIFDQLYDRPVWPQLRTRLPEEFRLFMVMEVQYGKTREWSDVHDRLQWVGFAAHDETGEVRMVSSRSSKQKAKDMALEGHSPKIIATSLGRPLRLVKEWLEIV